MKFQSTLGAARGAVSAGSGTSPAAGITRSSYKSYLKIVLVERLRWTSRCSATSLLIGSHSNLVDDDVSALLISVDVECATRYPKIYGQ